MKLKQLLENLHSQIHRVSPKLSNQEKSELRELLARLADAQGTLENAKEALFDYCWKNSYLSEALDKTGKPKKVIFRGRPDPRPLSKETDQVRLLANRLIDAIDKSKNT